MMEDSADFCITDQDPIRVQHLDQDYTLLYDWPMFWLVMIYVVIIIRCYPIAGWFLGSFYGYSSRGALEKAWWDCCGETAGLSSFPLLLFIYCTPYKEHMTRLLFWLTKVYRGKLQITIIKKGWSSEIGELFFFNLFSPLICSLCWILLCVQQLQQQILVMKTWHVVW